MGLFDLSGVVNSLATYDASVRRFAKDTYDANGRALPRTFSTVTAKVSLQPVSGKDLKRMPEGVDSSNMVTVHSSTELLMRDRVIVSSGSYEVEKVLAWSDIGSFCKVLARKLNDSEARS